MSYATVDSIVKDIQTVPPYVTRQDVLDWVYKTADLVKPDAIHWCTGSQEEYDALCS